MKLITRAFIIDAMGYRLGSGSLLRRSIAKQHDIGDPQGEPISGIASTGGFLGRQLGRNTFLLRNSIY